jgi:hypothetical protein
VPLLRWTFPSLLLLFLLVSAPAARGDLGVVLADPTTVGASVWTHAGHSLVYLSGVFAESPVHARLCQPGEQGSILTTYPDFHENRPYSWNLVPFSLYLYGSKQLEDRLLYASGPVKSALEDHARSGLLSSVCSGVAAPENSCPGLAHSYWRDLVAATAYRDVFIYAIQTTPEQNQLTVDWLNQNSNINHYNGLTNNCANFTRKLVNAIFPHSVHRDLLNDIGMMGPKAAARSFAHWALKRPDLGFYSMHFAQLPGDLPRCGLARSGTETAIHMKKYLIPAALIGEHEVAGSFFVAYYFTGRFGLYKVFSHYPAPSVVGLEAHAQQARRSGDPKQAATLLVSADSHRTEVVGSPQQWSSYRKQFAAIEDSVAAESVNLSPGSKFFPREYGHDEIIVDATGQPWLVVGSRQVGLSSNNLLSSQSDAAPAFQLILGRVGYALKAKDHMRETMEEFHQDWTPLKDARDRLSRLQQATLHAASR